MKTRIGIIGLAIALSALISWGQSFTAPTGSAGSVDWSAITGIPAGFADGTDDGGSGGPIYQGTIFSNSVFTPIAGKIYGTNQVWITNIADGVSLTFSDDTLFSNVPYYVRGTNGTGVPVFPASWKSRTGKSATDFPSWQGTAFEFKVVVDVNGTNFYEMHSLELELQVGTSHMASITNNGVITHQVTNFTGTGLIVLSNAPIILNPTLQDPGGTGITFDFGTPSASQVLGFHSATVITNTDAGAGSGDITAVGDVASGAAFDGSSGTALGFDNSSGAIWLTPKEANGSVLATNSLLPFVGDVPLVIYRGHALEITNTVTPTNIVSFTVPANALGTNRAIRVMVTGRYLLNSGGPNQGFTNYLYWGGTNFLAATSGNIVPATLWRDFETIFIIAAAGASQQQIHIQQRLSGVLYSQPAFGALDGTVLGKDSSAGATLFYDSTTNNTFQFQVALTTNDLCSLIVDPVRAILE